jgi:transcriptional regulator with XRE-family HTH domain
MREGFPGLLKRWRTSRRLSQEQLALDAEISTRHLSYLETGKSRPSREMVLLLASALELELKERNVMLTSAGFAPVYTSSALESLELAPVRKAIELLLEKQEPYGAVLVDRCWNVLRMNQGAMRMLARFVDPETVEPRIATNVVRAILHPSGMRPFLVNWLEVAQVALERLERECATYPTDETRRALLDEVRQYPGVEAISASTPATGAPMSLVHLKHGDDELRLFTMLTTIGTPLDVTAQELTLESYFPADEATERWLRAG